MSTFKKEFSINIKQALLQLIFINLSHFLDNKEAVLSFISRNESSAVEIAQILCECKTTAEERSPAASRIFV